MTPLLNHWNDRRENSRTYLIPYVVEDNSLLGIRINKNYSLHCGMYYTYLREFRIGPFSTYEEARDAWLRLTPAMIRRNLPVEGGDLKSLEAREYWTITEDRMKNREPY